MTSFIDGLVTTNDQYWFEEPSFESPKSVLSFDQRVISGGSLSVELDPGTSVARWTRESDYVILTHAKQKRFVDFIAAGANARLGRTRAFWFPSWTRDFVLANNYTTGTTVQIQAPTTFGKVFEANRYGIQILTNDGDTIINRIVAYDGTVSPEVMTVQVGLGRAVLISQVALFSLVRRVRMDQDKFSFQFKSDRACTLRINKREVLKEGAFL